VGYWWLKSHYTSKLPARCCGEPRTSFLGSSEKYQPGSKSMLTISSVGPCLITCIGAGHIGPKCYDGSQLGVEYGPSPWRKSLTMTWADVESLVILEGCEEQGNRPISMGSYSATKQWSRGTWGHYVTLWSILELGRCDRRDETHASPK